MVASALASAIPAGPEISTNEAIGILVSITGNILISFALNLQKLAHRKLELAREGSIRLREDNNGRPEDIPEEAEDATPTPSSHSEHEPLLPGSEGRPPNGSFLQRLTSFKLRVKSGSNSTIELPVDIAEIEPAAQPSTGTSTPSKASLPGTPRENSDNGQESDYLRSKLWWLGFILMNLGEIGNFISYAFAPASIVAPLGTFAIIANCMFAPFMLKERFRTRDIFGIFAAIIGAVTVVLSSNPSDAQLNPKQLVQAIIQPPFLAYTIVYIVTGVFLAGLSAKSPGSTSGHSSSGWVCVDVGLCALFGGFTVLSTKGFSTLLATEGLRAFTEWITYPLLAILAVTGVGQIRYLNRALMRFDSKVVIPAQFVFFNLSAIVGSAILYGDFRRASFHQIVTFLYGCSATCVGVFAITWSPSRMPAASRTEDSDEEEQGPTVVSVDGVESGSLPRDIEAGIRRELVGSVRNRRATLIVPRGEHPGLRHRPSVVSLVGLSPAQRILLVHSHPDEEDDYGEQQNGGPAHETGGGGSRRRGALPTSWYGAADGGDGSSPASWRRLGDVGRPRDRSRSRSVNARR